MALSLRFGTISSVHKDRHAARVEFVELDGMVTYELPCVLQRHGDFALLAAGTQVAVIMDDAADGPGVVLGAIYSDTATPPTSDEGRRVIAGSDVRLGDADATDKVALAPAVKDALQTLKDAISNAVVVAQDGGASLKATILAALAVWPPSVAAENVRAK